MSNFDFEALGRDAANAANSLGDSVVARAILNLLDWFGEGSPHADHLLHVTATKSDYGASVRVRVKAHDVYEAPVFAIPPPVDAPTPVSPEPVPYDPHVGDAAAAGEAA